TAEFCVLFSTSFSFLFPQSCFLFELPFAQQVSRLALLLSRDRVQVSKPNPVWSRAHHYGSVSRVPLHEDQGNALPFPPWRCADLPMFRSPAHARQRNRSAKRLQVRRQDAADCRMPVRTC